MKEKTACFTGHREIPPGQSQEIAQTVLDLKRMYEYIKEMVDNSSACICYLTQETGGTAGTVKYAVSHRQWLYGTQRRVSVKVNKNSKADFLRRRKGAYKG